MMRLRRTTTEPSNGGFDNYMGQHSILDHLIRNESGRMTEVVGLDGCTVTCVHPEKVAMVWSHTPREEELSEVARVFKILGDPTRTRLLYALLEAGELCVCDLSAATGISEVTLSQSLRLLRASRVVTPRREGRNVFYRLSDTHVRMLMDITREHVVHDNQASPAARKQDTL